MNGESRQPLYRPPHKHGNGGLDGVAAGCLADTHNELPENGVHPLPRYALSARDLTCRQTALASPVPAHTHDSCLISLVLGGSGQHQDEDGLLPILAGDVCVVLPGQFHAYPRVHGTLSLFNLAMTRAYLVAHTTLLAQVSWLGIPRPGEAVPSVAASRRPSVRLSTFELDRFWPLLIALGDELEDPRASEQPSVSTGLLLQILGLIGRGNQRNESLRPEEGLEADTGILAAIRYLEERYMGPISIEELADHAGYTPTYLTRKFRQQLGLSPSEYLLNLRIQHACSLLCDTRLPIASIAGHTGFHDSHYFATRFHHVMGMTPSSFRDQFRTE